MANINRYFVGKVGSLKWRVVLLTETVNFSISFTGRHELY